jgi:hypothetical protein
MERRAAEEGLKRRWLGREAQIDRLKRVLGLLPDTMLPVALAESQPAPLHQRNLGGGTMRRGLKSAG